MFTFVLYSDFCICVWLLWFWVYWVNGMLNGCCWVGGCLYWFGVECLVLNFGWNLAICVCFGLLEFGLLVYDLVLILRLFGCSFPACGCCFVLVVCYWLLFWLVRWFGFVICLFVSVGYCLVVLIVLRILGFKCLFNG